MSAFARESGVSQGGKLDERGLHVHGHLRPHRHGEDRHDTRRKKGIFIRRNAASFLKGIVIPDRYIASNASASTADTSRPAGLASFVKKSHSDEQQQEPHGPQVDASMEPYLELSGTMEAAYAAMLSDLSEMAYSVDQEGGRATSGEESSSAGGLKLEARLKAHKLTFVSCSETRAHGPLTGPLHGASIAAAPSSSSEPMHRSAVPAVESGPAAGSGSTAAASSQLCLEAPAVSAQLHSGAEETTPDSMGETLFHGYQKAALRVEQLAQQQQEHTLLVVASGSNDGGGHEHSGDSADGALLPMAFNEAGSHRVALMLQSINEDEMWFDEEGGTHSGGEPAPGSSSVIPKMGPILSPYSHPLHSAASSTSYSSFVPGRGCSALYSRNFPALTALDEGDHPDGHRGWATRPLRRMLPRTFRSRSLRRRIRTTALAPKTEAAAEGAAAASTTAAAAAADKHGYGDVVTAVLRGLRLLPRAEEPRTLAPTEGPAKWFAADDCDSEVRYFTIQVWGVWIFEQEDG